MLNFDYILSVDIHSEYIDTFVIINGNEQIKVNDFSNTSKYYKFNELNGTMKVVEFNANIAKVDSIVFASALHDCWYSIINDKIKSIEAKIDGINVDNLTTYCNLTESNVDIAIMQYNVIHERIKYMKKVVNLFNVNRTVNKTIENIVSVLYDGVLVHDYNEIKQIDNELNIINEQIDKDNDTINLVNLKKAINAFTTVFWQSDESCGINPYVYNCNATLCVYVIGTTRKQRNDNGVYKWTSVKTDTLMKHIVVAMLIRLAKMQKDIDDNNKSTSEEMTDNKTTETKKAGDEKVNLNKTKKANK